MAHVSGAAITRSPAASFSSGALIGMLGGLIGLGGAEFRLPLLIGWFRFAALEAVILNKTMSLFVVACSLLFRTRSIPLTAVAEHWIVIANLLGGSLLGAWLAAGWATRVRSAVLYRVMAVLLVVIALALLFGHEAEIGRGSLLQGPELVIAGLAAGFAIGVVASLMGVAGGELLIPTLILLFGLDVKVAGSLSLAVSLPTMLMGFARYSRDRSFGVIRRNRRFILFMATGSLAGAFTGSLLLGIVPSAVLLPTLAAILLVSAIKVWRHA